MPQPASSPLTKWLPHQHQHVSSTNDLAIADTLAAWDAQRPAHGILHIAASQSAGRGQHGRTWVSPPGGLYLSAVVENIPPEARDRLALVAGVAVAHALTEFGCSTAKIRWPNDLVIDNKKIAGILCESLARGHQFATIIGIGINVNTRPGDLPSSLQSRATSLAALHGHPIDTASVSTAVAHHLALAIHNTQTNGLAWAIQQVRDRDALIGKALAITTENSQLRGTAAGISDHGDLILLCENARRTLATGTIYEVDGQAVRE